MPDSGGSVTLFVPHMLPPQASIVDRDPPMTWALNHVAAAECAQQQCRLWFTGVPGVGKTALAVSLGYRLIDRYPDGQFYVELGGSTADGPADPAEVLAMFLRALGVERDDIPTSLAERQARFRTMIYDRRILVVLDDAADLPQVKALLPTSPLSVVIVTSTGGHTGTRAARFKEEDVDGLKDDHATQLLARLLGAERLATEPEALDILLKVCAGLPLAHEVFAGVASRRPNRRIKDMVAPLAAGSTDVRNPLFAEERLGVTFDYAVRHLDPDDAKAYLILSLHPGPDISIRSAAAMLGRTVTAAEDVLDDLAHVRVLKRTPDGRYRFHAFAARHARERAFEDLSEAERTAAVQSLITCRLEWAVGLAKSLWPRRPWTGGVFARVPPAYTGTDAVRRASAEFEAEQHNFRAAFDAAADAAEAAARDHVYDPRRDIECAYLALALKQWLYETGQAADLVEMMKRGSAAAERTGDQPLIIRMQNELGTAYELKDEFTPALKAFHASAEPAKKMGDLLALASAVEWQGIVEGRRGNHEAALRLLREARSIVSSQNFDPLERPRALALLRMHIGRTLVNLKRAEEAVHELEAASEYFLETNEPINVLRTALTRSDALAALGRARKANNLLTETVASIDGPRLGRKRVAAWKAMARNNCTLGDLTEARTCLQSACDLATDLHLVEEQLEITLSLADLHREQGDTAAAAELLRSARELATTLGATVERVAVLRSVAAGYRSLGDEELARDCINEADTMDPDTG